MTDDDNILVIDRSKLRRERARFREKLRKEDKKFQLVNGIYIDGKKDATLTVTEINGIRYKNTILEEHYVVIGEPGEFYLTHVEPENGIGNLLL